MKADWHHYYGTATWKWTRTKRLSEEPLCRFCKAKGKIVAATTVDHIIPHKGDWGLFSDHDNTQSLCTSCHSGTKQQQETLGYSTETGTDGFPVDPNHPANR